ncbi:DUF2254 family protein [Hydrogenophaga sp. 5NK40-0174]|uniref:DUF2254 domain-containing protein n=1 Tax=Hydrogenophaga sp. 5NK40-0174 TaxID=3127649 RepID=UPI003107FE94
MSILYRLSLWLRDPRNLIWTTPAAASALAVLLALAAALVNNWLDHDLVPDIRIETIDSLLTVIASSMLSVTTFSLGIMLSAFASASSSASPRATELVMADDSTRIAIASFIAAFIYAVIAKTALGMDYYGASGRFVLFACTVGVLVYLIFTLIKWVKTLSHLGRLPSTLEKLERAACKVIDEYHVAPLMGCRMAPVQVPDGTRVFINAAGYLTHINLLSLNELASETGATVHVRVRPGAFILHDTVLAVVEGECPEDAVRTVQHAFVIQHDRSFDQDPMFGLGVISEVAQRALSPAVNDPGTAFQVLTVLTRLLLRLRPGFEADEPPDVKPLDHLTMVGLDEGEFVRAGYDPISRDGASLVELGMALQQHLGALVRCSDLRMSDAAAEQARVAMGRAELGLSLPHDVARVRKAHKTAVG